MAHATQGLKVVNVTPPAAIVDNASFTTNEIDTLGFDYCTVYVSLGATDVDMTALKVQESDTSGSGHADVTGLVFGTSDDADSGTTSALPLSTDDNGVFAFHIDLKGRKRYLDIVATAGNGAAGTYASILAVLDRANNVPTTAVERGLVSNLIK